MILEILKPVRLKTKNGSRVFQPGETIKAHSGNLGSLIDKGFIRPTCPSVEYSEAGLQSCGQGWLCDRCKGAGDRLKTVYFWSETLHTILDLSLPERDLYDYQRVMEARQAKERGIKNV